MGVNVFASQVFAKFGTMALCLPSIGRICELLLTPPECTLSSHWTEPDLPETNVFNKNIDLRLLSMVISLSISNVQELKYFLSNAEGLSEAISNNSKFFQLLLEEEVSADIAPGTVMDLNGPITNFVEKLSDILIDNAATLLGEDTIAYLEVLPYILTLPECFTERNGNFVKVISGLFERISPDEYFVIFDEISQSCDPFVFIDSLIASCNSFISISLAMLDNPNRPVSGLTIVTEAEENIGSKPDVFQAVYGLMGLIHDYITQRLFSLDSAKATMMIKLLQNEYINSSYNITPDTDFYLKTHEEYDDNLAVLPEQLEILIQQRRAHINRNFPPNMFSVLDYPFLLNSVTKRQIFRYEATFNIPHIGELHVQRDDIVNSALLFVEKEGWRDSRNRLRLRIPVNIKFDGEEGVDAGGLSNEFFTLICGELFSDRFNLFTFNQETRFYWFEHFPIFETEEELLNAYSFVGVILGLAFLNAVNVDHHFPMVLFKMLLLKDVCFEDLEELDPYLHKGLLELLNYEGYDLEDVFCLSFSVIENSLGVERVVELIPNGAQVSVTEENKEEYVDEMVRYHFYESIQKQYEAFEEGFYLVTRTSTLWLFTPEEMELALCGESTLDFDELRKAAKYEEPYSPTHEIVVWFWEIVGRFSEEDKVNFMRFVFGSPRAPAGGLIKQRFEIHKNGADDVRLPTSHTCFGILMLPQYSSAEVLEQKLRLAIVHNEGFGLK